MYIFEPIRHVADWLRIGGSPWYRSSATLRHMAAVWPAALDQTSLSEGDALL
jgi:hypothetical protein